MNGPLKEYTTFEAAAYLRCNPVTIRRMVNDGRLKAYRVGPRLRFTQMELDRYKKKNAA